MEAGVVELNTRGRYAVTAMADLARYGGGGALALSTIAERQQISLSYLEQLFLKLRRAGLVESARGRSGGYRLGRAAHTITVGEVMAAVEEDIRMTRCNGAVDQPCLPGQRCLTRAVGCAGRSNRRLPARRHAARGDRWHSRSQAGGAD